MQIRSIQPPYTGPAAQGVTGTREAQAESTRAQAAALLEEAEVQTGGIAGEENLEEKAPWEMDFQSFLKSQEAIRAAKEAKISTSKPKDSSGRLTARLVSASEEFAVRMVVSDVFREMVSLRMTAASSDSGDKKKAQALLRKLEKVLNRCYSKIDDLSREGQMDKAAKKAGRQKQEKRAEEIKQELRSERRKRQGKESRYLLEKTNEQICETLNEALQSVMGAVSGRLDAATEAQIEAQAQAMAAAEASVGGGGSFAAGADAVVEATGGGSAAPAANGDAGAATGGSVDITV